ncbi:polyprenyl synthetase family protein [Effusibacillus pohliae]|uniref:polyprenyl synthetase family protein n=1 Tax=Effusibacillus pohliae TaxID=232270 RepID=UPI0003801E0F|nr:polyprenyl synthetase family protein [Effusibacillus pohliae]
MDHPLLHKVDQKLRYLLRTDIPSLRPLVDHFMQTRGKGVRPLLVLLCGEIAASPVNQSIDLAAAVELLHMASLVHDDLVDHSDLRRQQATIHRLWGERAAVLVGDYFFGKMLRVISAYPPAVPLFAAVIEHLVGGEFLQADQQYDAWLPETEYLNRIYHKTAFFMANCCKIGCLPGHLAAKKSEALTRFGYCLGMAYQLWDDLQDILETPDAIGKPVMQDVARGVYTLPYLHAFQYANRHFSSDSDKHQIPRESIAYTAGLAAQYIEKSARSLSALPPSNAKNGLLQIAWRLKTKIEQLHSLQEADRHAPSLD